MDNRSLGQIITFYSYKGGTGRSMTLANVACLLAERNDITPGKGVLMMDWDLEAPGLHRYFSNRLAPRKRASDSRGTGNCDAEPGLIDLFYELDAKTDLVKEQSESLVPGMFAEDVARKILDEIDLDQYVIPTTVTGLSLLKAGRFNRKNTNEYPERVNKFNWEALYNKSPQLMRVFAEVLSEKYDYVLIDSRTGITDISGVCTMLLPEKLVVVFTPNMQSLMGAVEVVRRATDYRKESDDLRSLLVFPLVSRVESNEPDLRHDWRFGNPERGIIGYQAEFENVLAQAYGKDGVDLGMYFDEMQIQHIPRFAYGEEIAVLEERTIDKFSLRRGYMTFANKLIENDLPWDGMSIGEVPSPAQYHPGYEPAMVTAVKSSNFRFLVIASICLVALILAAVLIGIYSLDGKYSGNTMATNTASNMIVKQPGLSNTFERQYTGTIAGMTLTMTLNKDGNNLTGTATTGTKSDTLSGTIEENGAFRVDAFEKGLKLATGVYVGQIFNDGSLTGMWTNPKGLRERWFRAQQTTDVKTTPTGTWTGDWSSPSGAYLTGILELDDAAKGTVKGYIIWTLKDTKRPDKIAKIGMSATEYVEGEFDPDSRLLSLKGYKKDDPNNVLVMLDSYRLVLSEDSHKLKGVARNGGPWDSQVNLTR